ncbi:signal peptidase I [Aliidongia dinghuensis]|uniref:Signal peptidase I n=1 Tax=Aliidongia dinghuensis TaxID=1867774 RepID=A0A8J2YP88_9PROT|nr:signal peptidase I [Aliidongia dinghuensis]GGE99353.1 signal peptidase I [Aliidongia dinghuensis]
MGDRSTGKTVTSKRKGEWRSTIATLVVTLLCVLTIRTVAAEPFVVPSGSMVPTLLVGDELVAAKYPYGIGKYSSPIGLMPDFDGRIAGHAPERGDVILFRLPRDPEQTYVKRLVGLPGDRIQMKAGRLLINGVALTRRAVGSYEAMLDGKHYHFTRYVETLPGGREHPILKRDGGSPLDDTVEFTVPARHYFMMGDNRDMSLDSRVPAEAGGVGFVPEENLVGRADRVLYSRDPAVAAWDLADWREIFRSDRFLGRID